MGAARDRSRRRCVDQHPGRPGGRCRCEIDGSSVPSGAILQPGDEVNLMVRPRLGVCAEGDETVEDALADEQSPANSDSPRPATALFQPPSAASSPLEELYCTYDPAGPVRLPAGRDPGDRRPAGAGRPVRPGGCRCDSSRRAVRVTFMRCRPEAAQLISCGRSRASKMYSDAAARRSTKLEPLRGPHGSSCCSGADPGRDFADCLTPYGPERLHRR